MLNVGVLPLVATFIGLLFYSTSGWAGSAPSNDVAGEIVSTHGKVFVRQDGRKAADKLNPAQPGDSVHAGDVINTPSDGSVKILLKDKSIVDLGPSALFKVDSFKKNEGTNRQADMSMMYGTLRAVVSQKIEGKGRFRIRTPAATMGVRGTEFVVKSEVKNMDEIRHVVIHPDKPLPPPPTPKEKLADGKPAPVAKAEAAKTEITVIQGAVEVKKEAPKPEKNERGRALASVAPQVVQLTAGTQLTANQADAAPVKAVQLDVKQLASITKEVKVIDNTFSKAVVIDNVASQGGASGGGMSGLPAMSEATKNALSNIVTVVPAAPISMNDIGFAGTFNTSQSFQQKPMPTTTSFYNVRVIVVRKAATGGL